MEPVNSLPEVYNDIDVNKKQRNRIVIIVVVVISLVLLIGLGFWAYKKGYLPRISKLTPSPSSSPELVFAPAPILPENFDKKLQDGPFSCPLLAAFCKVSSSYQGASFSAKFNSTRAVYAVFDGTAEGLTANHPLPDGDTEQFVQVLLTNSRRGLQAYYSFKGSSAGKINVRAGDVIANASGNPLNFMGDSSLVFEMSKLDSDGYTPFKMVMGIFKP